MNVEEFELTPLKKALLRYTDEDTNDKDLVYTIAVPIVELSPITPLADTGTTFGRANFGSASSLRVACWDF